MKRDKTYNRFRRKTILAGPKPRSQDGTRYQRIGEGDDDVEGGWPRDSSTLRVCL